MDTSADNNKAFIKVEWGAQCTVLVRHALTKQQGTRRDVHGTQAWRCTSPGAVLARMSSEDGQQMPHASGAPTRGHRHTVHMKGRSSDRALSRGRFSAPSAPPHGSSPVSCALVSASSTERGVPTAEAPAGRMDSAEAIREDTLWGVPDEIFLSASAVEEEGV